MFAMELRRIIGVIFLLKVWGFKEYRVWLSCVAGRSLKGLKVPDNGSTAAFGMTSLTGLSLSFFP